MNKSYILFTQIVLIYISCVFALPVTRMRVCVQSNDPSRLQSQCVYCNNRMFVGTVRHCTSNTYLPASLSVEEAFCLVKLCRRQMPSMRPEPFYPNNVNNIQTTVDNIGPNDVDYTESEALYSENHSSPPTVPKRRPPASFSVGKPQRPGLVRPLLFGKRSVSTSFDEYLNHKNNTILMIVS